METFLTTINLFFLIKNLRHIMRHKNLMLSGMQSNIILMLKHDFIYYSLNLEFLFKIIVILMF